MASLRISQLANLIGTDVSANDLLAIVDMSASETKNIDVTNLAQALAPLFPADSIPGDSVDIKLEPGSVGTTELADKSVTAVKLANSSTGLYGLRPALGSYIGQICVDDGKAYMWDGSSWKTVDGPNAIIGITWDGTGPVAISTTSIEDNVAKVGTAFVDSTAARQFVAGPTAAAGLVTYRQIVGADLPTAGAAEQGAVQVAGGGLAMNGTLIEIDNTIAPSAGAFYLVDYDEHGLVVDSRVIQAADLPVATESSNGVMRPGTGLVVTGAGVLNHENVAVAGTFTKVTVDAVGHVTNGGNIDSTDVPELPADKIVGGTFNPALIAAESVDGSKLVDYSTCFIQPNQPLTGEFLGKFWLNPDTSQLYAYASGSAQDYWIPVGFGRLAQENLRFCGTFDASDSSIKTLTEYGVQAGLTQGPIPEATGEMTGVYLVCTTAGNAVNLPNVSGISITEGDWILAVNEAWEFIDVAQGGGGGGGARVLNDLLDVQVDTTRELGQAGALAKAGYALATGDLLTYDSESGMWKNQPPAEVVVPEKTSDLTNDGEDGSNPFVTQADIDASITAADIPKELDDLSDVNVPDSPDDGDVLTWNGSEWISSPPAATMPEPDTDGVYLRKAEGDVYTWEDAAPLFIPMNDWSGLPKRPVARTTPPPPAPAPMPIAEVDPVVSGDISSAGTVDIVDLEDIDE